MGANSVDVLQTCPAPDVINGIRCYAADLLGQEDGYDASHQANSRIWPWTIGGSNSATR